MYTIFKFHIGAWVLFYKIIGCCRKFVCLHILTWQNSSKVIVVFKIMMKLGNSFAFPFKNILRITHNLWPELRVFIGDDNKMTNQQLKGTLIRFCFIIINKFFRSLGELSWSDTVVWWLLLIIIRAGSPFTWKQWCCYSDIIWSLGMFYLYVGIWHRLIKIGGERLSYGWHDRFNEIFCLFDS